MTHKMIFETPNLINNPFGTRTIKFLDDRLVETITSEKQLPKQYQKLIPDIKYVKSLIDNIDFGKVKP
ncbi:hypothetical protein [Flavisericum labens]|uniref:hypothetical protein n=1 Tax=Flavisericum labens TaxID=3377112 RepID=UPI00387A8DED